MSKKFFTFILSLAIVINIGFSQIGWFWQNPLPVGSHLKDCYFVDSNIGYACGDNGSIIKTTNAGLNWIQLNCGCNRFLTSIFFLNQLTGYVTSGDNRFQTNSVILKTSDGGLSWIEIYTFVNTHLSAVNFYNENTGYAVGGKYWSGGRIYKTTNSGLNWALYPDLPTMFMNSIFFTSIDTTYVAGDGGKILKTTNQGINWDFLNTGINNYTTFNSIVFTTANTGYAAGNGGRIYKTTDMGDNWTLLNTGTFGGFAEITFCDIFTGFACGWGRIFRTTNSGNSWDSLSILSTENLTTIKSLNLNSVICCGYNGTVLKSTNSGTNWSILSTKIISSPLNSSFIFDTLNYCIVGDSSKVVRTSNGGNSWLISYVGGNYELNSVYFSNTNSGFLAGGYSVYYPPLTSYYAKIFKTTNSGLNWALVYGQNQEGNLLRNIKFVNSLTGYCVGGSTNFSISNFVVLKTTNSGINWTINHSGNYGDLYSIFFTDLSTIYVCGSNGLICKTSNGGASWSTLPSGVSSTLFSIHFPSVNIGYAATFNQIIKTTNAGVNWNIYNVNIPYEFDINEIFFLNINTGYAVGVSFGDYGRAGDIIKTTNGGLNWIHLSTFNSSPTYMYRGLRSISFVNNTGLILGELGTILKTTTGGEPIGTEPVINNFPDKFTLHQNYPNPFNPSTKIRFDIPLKANNIEPVRLIIYDVLGREIATLVNEQLKPGSYEVDWDGSNYSSGVYFYKLIAGDFVQTKKMVLLK